MTITGTTHYDFSDLLFISPASALIGFKGPLPTRRVMEIVNTFAVTFFDAAFSGTGDTALLELGESFPEVEIELSGQ
jgi:hypothetical protein